MNTTYKIYWTYAGGYADSCTETELEKALGTVELLRKTPGYTFVTMACENTDQVGKMGVDAVEGKWLPNGGLYDWVKRR